MEIISIDFIKNPVLPNGDSDVAIFVHMKIKVDQVLKREAAKKLEIKPLPKVKLSNVPETKAPRSEVANGNLERENHSVIA
jgi:hypothetical protein